MRPKFNRQPRKIKPRINNVITCEKVRVVRDDGEMLGVLSTEEAISIASADGLDLVEISPQADPPVCKIIDFGKFSYQQDKKKKEAKKNQKVVQLKEIKMRPKTDVHDYNFKVKHVKEFLANGDKVKITIRFKGREMAHQESGKAQLDKVVLDTEGLAKVEVSAKMEGRQMFMLLVPIAKK